MPQSPVPIRTYTIAATLSLVLNAGVVGTFAVVGVRGTPGAGGLSKGLVAVPLVLSELALPEEKPKEKPEEKPRAVPEPASKPVPPEPSEAKEPMPEREVPRPDVAMDEPPDVVKPWEREVKLGNPDAPDRKTDVWLGVSKGAGVVRGPRSPIEQGDFRKGLPGSRTGDRAGAESSTASSNAGREARGSKLVRESTPQTPRATLVRPATEGAASTSLAKAQEPPTALGDLHSLDSVRDAVMADEAESMPPFERPVEMLMTEEEFAARLDMPLEPGSSLAEHLRDFVQRSIQSAAAAESSVSAAPTPPVMPWQKAIALAQERAHDKAGEKQDAGLSPTAESAIPSAATAPAVGSGQNGNGADRESDAFSKSDPVDVTPGQPLAGKGLAIKTVAPRFTTTTRQMIRARNPIIRVTFGRDGRVIRAEYLPGKDAGHPDVSGPLRDAVLMWTAQGDELLTIPQNDPLAGVFIEFKIILN